MALRLFAIMHTFEKIKYSWIAEFFMFDNQNLK